MIRKTFKFTKLELGWDRLLRYGGALASRGLEAVGKFGLYMLAARSLGGADSGLFFLCLTWVNLCSTAARLGLERAMSRHVAAELAIGQRDAARAALLTGIGWTTVASACAGVATMLLAPLLADFVFSTPELARPLTIAAFVLVPQSLAFAVGYALIGLDRSISGQMVQSALPPVLTVAGLLVGVHTLDSLLWLYVASYGGCTLLGAALIVLAWRNGRRASAARTSLVGHEMLPSIWATARPFLVIELVQSALLSAPVLLLGSFAEPTAVSAFSIASRLTMLINTMLLSIALLAAPGFAAHHRRKEFSALRRLDRQTSGIAVLICLPVLLALIIFAGPILDVMSSNIPGATTALFILAAGQLVNILLPTQDMMLSMTGHGSILRRLSLQQLAICLVLGVVLIYYFGMVGAALISTACLIQGRISFAIAVRRFVPEISLAR